MSGRLLFEGLYRRAEAPEDLPWHRDELPPLLERCLAERRSPTHVLDVGCGAGTFALQIAARGHRVTAVDFVAGALRMARERANRVGADVRLILADVLRFEPSAKFDVVLDSGCLHSLSPRRRPRYRDRLVSWLAPGGDYVLVHFGKRHLLDWNPIGPRRRPRAAVERLFRPALVARAYEERLVDAGFPLGRQVLIASYWFHRASP
jgi:SAM-dependent methyltransferase